MKLEGLSSERYAELKPYVDTLIQPVCAIGHKGEGVPPAGDCMQVRQAAISVEEQLSGRVFLLPEMVHTQMGSIDRSTPDELLVEYLYRLLLPYKEEGMTKAVLLYGTGTPKQAMEQAASLLTEKGFGMLAIRIVPGESGIESVVRKIISLWNS